VAQFDAVRPEGADYVIVPAQAAKPRLLASLKQQAGQGATKREVDARGHAGR